MIDNVWIYLIIYVDDIIIGSKEGKLINDVIDMLRRSFDIVYLGNLSNYLGMSIERDDKGIFCLSQPRYIKRIIDSVGLHEAKISTYPLDPGYENIENSEDVMEDSNKISKADWKTTIHCCTFMTGHSSHRFDIEPKNKMCKGFRLDRS